MKAKIALAYSIKDPAGKGVAKLLVDYLNGEKTNCQNAVECFVLENNIFLGGYNEDSIELEFVDKTPDPSANAIIILSRHSSESRKKTLTVHHTGNPTERTLGGRPKELAVSFPALSKALLNAYRNKAEALGLLEEYDLKLEATHHGPTTPRKPIVFIEIGSTIEEWKDPKAREAMAQAVIDVLNKELPKCKESSGFGGSHYPIKFTELQLNSEYCLGHIIPKYAFNSGVEDRIIVEALTKSYPRESQIGIIEKKSLRSTDRKNVIKIIESLGKEVLLV